jgi:hypothetical protein
VSNDSGVQPGWYADPMGRFELRYFNGAAWTADVSTNGVRFVDPLGLAVAAGDGDSTTTAAANGPASAAMVLGIIAVATAWLPFIVVVGVIAAVLAVALGLVGLRRSQTSGVGRNRAIVGLATGASGLIAGSLGVMLTVIVLGVYDDYLHPAPHEVTITSCTMAGSRATATGVLTNLGDSTAGFSVVVDFVRPGTDNVDRQGRTDVDDVAAGDSIEFIVERQVSLDEVDCTVSDVNGPLPFGLALD